MTAVPPIRLGINIDHVATLRNARGGQPSRSPARGDDRGRSRRRQHHRASARRSAAYHRRRYRAARGEPDGTAQHGDGGDAARCSRSRSRRSRMPAASCRRSAPSAPPKAGSKSLASITCSRRSSRRLGDAGIQVSLFIAPDLRPDRGGGTTSARHAIEIHVGPWCEALSEGREREARGRVAAHRRMRARAAHGLGLEVHAGHGLDYATAATISAIPEIVELNIGHFLVGEAVFVGLGESVRRMRASDGSGAGELAAKRHGGNDEWRRRDDPRPRQRHHRHPPRRAHHRALRRALSVPRVHRYRAAEVGRPRRPRRLLRQALRRQGGLRQGFRHRLSPGRVLARHGGRKFALGPPDAWS